MLYLIIIYYSLQKKKFIIPLKKKFIRVYFDNFTIELQ